MSPVNSYLPTSGWINPDLIPRSTLSRDIVERGTNRLGLIILPKLYYLENVNNVKKVKTGKWKPKAFLDSKNVKIIECQHYGFFYGHVCNCAVCI